MYEFKPDFDEALRRLDAWWNGELLDRPPVHITFPGPESRRIAAPAKSHDSERDRWLDAEFQADNALAAASGAVWYAEALPVFWPNLGPDVFAAFYGCELEFGHGTSWSVPILEDWSEESLAKIRLDTDNFYYRKLIEMTDAYIDRGRDRFIVGYTDMHPGGDAVAALRDPQPLCMDLLQYRDQIVALLDRVTDDFFQVYDFFYDRMRAAGMHSSSWTNMTCNGRFHIPSNDFSCMVSREMFDDVFLPGIRRECAYMDCSIYHLDGPDALKHLDSLMEVPNLQAIQWVYGVGQPGWRHWLDVYRRIQERGLGFQMFVGAGELDDLMEALSPRGAYLCIGGVANQAEADAVLRKLERWTAAKG